MDEQWEELKETITELRDNNGTATQQEVCKFLVNLMNELERQSQAQEPIPSESETAHWCVDDTELVIYCSNCYEENDEFSEVCPHCHARMMNHIGR